MEDKKKLLASSYRQLLATAEDKYTTEEIKLFRTVFSNYEQVADPEAAFDGMLRTLGAALILQQEVNLGKALIFAKLFFGAVHCGFLSYDQAQKMADPTTSKLLEGLMKTEDLSNTHSSAMESENFRQLLLALAHDVRVIVILICDRLYMLQNIMNYPEAERDQIAREASFLYAPLAHRMGLYHVKSQLEDLSMKFLHYDIYKEIAKGLNETKRSRDAYITAFIEPLKKKLADAGFKCSVKGRTKSIFSIWNKIKKQNTTLAGIYDLFAIRIILDAPLDQEKSQCWQVYSIITDMYTPDVKRLRDWLSIPKSNGYESLHTTVMGPQGKWVEVQIRTQRMDEIAEKGLAAHFKYKGVKGEADFDQFLSSVREILEHPDQDVTTAMDDFKLSLYDKEVYVFTPSGELRKFPKGATLLDFAFQIHSRLGAQCVGGRINGKNMPIRYVLKNGDQIEINTSANQKVTKEWLSIVQTSKAKAKIKQLLREQTNADAEIGKEILQRRFRNWKIEVDESMLAKFVLKKGYPNIADFYTALAQEKIDIMKVRDDYQEYYRKEKRLVEDNTQPQSAADFETTETVETQTASDDVLVIDKNLKGIQYELARCCNPIFGDPVFGFVSSKGLIKVHKTSCPNAPQLISRFGYRVVKARWSGKSVGNQFMATIRVVGRDDIGIMTNISSLIQREANVALRSVSVDSVDGLFQGNITVRLDDTTSLEALIRKIRTVKGVTSVSRY